MLKTYIVHCVMQGEKYTTLTLKGTEENCVDWLRNNVESADGSPASTMQAYLAICREYMEEEGGIALWDVLELMHPDRIHYTELECFVNGYEWHDDWDRAGTDAGMIGSSTQSLTITL